MLIVNKHDTVIKCWLGNSKISYAINKESDLSLLMTTKMYLSEETAKDPQAKGLIKLEHLKKLEH